VPFQSSSAGFHLQPSSRFKYRLALDLKKTIAEIDAMDRKEYTEWIAYYRFNAEQERLASKS
jgi:hypothetical protein